MASTVGKTTVYIPDTIVNEINPADRPSVERITFAIFSSGKLFSVWEVHITIDSIKQLLKRSINVSILDLYV